MSGVSTHPPVEPLQVEHVLERKTFSDTPLRKFFEAALKYEASDLLMRAGQSPMLRIRGKLRALETGELDAGDFEKWVEAGVSQQQWQQYALHGSLDIGYDLKEGHRFRVNLFRTRGKSAIAARRVSSEIANFEQLHLPAAVMRTISEQHQGLILLCGVTGSGKSTTIASMIQYINENRACHVVTIEDPIEYLFEDKKAMINQREVGIDVPDFQTGLRALVRENPTWC